MSSTSETLITNMLNISNHNGAVELTVATCLFVLLSNVTQPCHAQYGRGQIDIHYLTDLDYFSGGKQIALSGDKIRVVNVASKEVVHTTTPNSRINVLRCSPVDATVFAVGSENGTVSIYEVGKQKPRQTYPANTKPVTSINGMAWSPDGKYLAASGIAYSKGAVGKGTCNVWDAATGKRLFTLDKDGIGCHAVAFSPDGTMFAVSLKPNASSSSMLVVSTDNWKEQRRIPFSPGFANDISFTPDNRQLIAVGGFCKKATNGCMPTGRIWHARLDSNEPPRMFVPTAESQYFSGVDPLSNDRFFVVGEIYDRGLRRNVEMWSAGTGEKLWARRGGGGGGEMAVRISPDNESVAYLDKGRRGYQLITISVSGSPRNANQTTLFELPYKRVMAPR